MDHLVDSTSTHPVRACAAEIEAALKSVADVDPLFMGVDDKAEALVELTRLGDRLEALRMRVIGSAGDVARRDGCRTVAGWITPRTLTRRGDNARSEHLALALDRRWRATGHALEEGQVNVAQARVIADALDAVASEADAEVLARAEAHLLEQARHFGPRALERLGQKILEVVAPETYEEQERRALEAAQRRANAATRLRLRRRGDGSTDLTARIPDSAAARLKTYLEAWTSPRHDRAVGGGDIGVATGALGPRAGGRVDPATGARLPYDRLLGQAFCSFLEAADPARMPLHGGGATSIVVTIPLADLRSGLGAGTLADDAGAEGKDETRITASEARRLACAAGIIPAVLGGQSEVLDLGRTRRLFTARQRLAMAVQHPVCRAEGCDVPATWCEAHHAGDPWSQGGRTDLDEGKLLCSWHHHRAHDPGYRLTHLPNGDLRYHRRR